MRVKLARNVPEHVWEGQSIGGERGQRERGRQEGLSEEVTFQLGSKE